MTPEDKEALSYLAISDTYKSVLKLLDILTEDMDKNVLRCNIEEDEGKKLLREKLRSEGALQLKQKLKKYLDKLKDSALK